jgi:hypothetical protein
MVKIFHITQYTLLNYKRLHGTKFYNKFKNTYKYELQQLIKLIS